MQKSSCPFINVTLLSSAMIHSNFLVFYNKNYSLIFLQLVSELIKNGFTIFLTSGLLDTE